MRTSLPPRTRLPPISYSYTLRSMVYRSRDTRRMIEFAITKLSRKFFNVSFQDHHMCNLMVESYNDFPGVAHFGVSDQHRCKLSRGLPHHPPQMRSEASNYLSWAPPNSCSRTANSVGDLIGHTPQKLGVFTEYCAQHVLSFQYNRSI